MHNTTRVAPRLTPRAARRRPISLGLETLESRLLCAITVLPDQFGALASFTGNGKDKNGNQPAGLVLAPNGDLYGTTARGGSLDFGTIYKVAAGTAEITVIANFDSTHGAYPIGNLALDANGNLFGATLHGGAYDLGTVFELPAGSSTITTLGTFTGRNGSGPVSGVILDPDGNLYGTAYGYPGTTTKRSTVYTLTAGGSPITTLAYFSSKIVPTGGLAFDPASHLLYGTTRNGGTSSKGSIFTVDTADPDHPFTTLASFNGTNGNFPNSSLFLDNGFLYGTAIGGGAKNTGTLYKVVASAPAPTPIILISSFDSTSGNAPIGDLRLDASGNLIGTTTTGGKNGAGALFAYSQSGSTFVRLASLFSSTSGRNPTGPLVIDADGRIFGTAYSGGKHNYGTLFEFSPEGTPQVPVRLVLTSQPDHSIAGQPLATTLTLRIEDAFGNLDESNTSNVTIAIHSGPAGGTLNGTTTVAAVGGIATFPGLSIDQAGAYTFTFTDGILAPVTTDAFNVHPDEASAHLVLTTQPNGTMLNAPLAPTLVFQIKDQFGNLVDNNSKVTLAVTAGPGTLKGTKTVTAFDGVATFNNLSLSAAGTYTLTATDPSLADPTPVSFTQEVTPTQLVIQAPANASAGALLAPVIIRIQHPNGTTDTANNSNVTIAFASGPNGATLLGTTTVAAVNGVATFSDLSTLTAGAYTFSATSGAMASLPSKSFTISPDAASARLVITQNPSNTAAGIAPTTPFIVQIQDQYGNLVTKNNAKVTLSIVSGTFGAKISGATVSASGGIATFKNFTLNKAGAYVLRATSSSLPVNTPVDFAIAVARGQTTVNVPALYGSYKSNQKISISSRFFSDASTSLPFTGTATVVDQSSNVLGTATLSGNGNIKFTVGPLAPGTYICSIVYPGDINHTAVVSEKFILTILA